jgi:hypothetical protein
MLRHTLILPEGDGPLAARLLDEAIDALDVVLMLVLGADPRAEQITDWADQLCNRTQMTPSVNLRRVVWIREPEVVEVKVILSRLSLSNPLPRVAVLDFYDQVRARLEEPDIDPMALEIAFLKGQALPKGQKP